MTGLRILTLISALVMALAASAAERTIIVLDGSGSMWGQINGTTKIEIARETLAEVLGSVPGTMELGLMVYGHREKGSCSDIELAVAPAAGTGAAIAAFANSINPKGKTPISASVKMAAEQLRYQEDKATVILVTDGLETCEADPCALATELEAGGVDFTAHVVGFGLTEDEGRQVACLAENTGGKYFKADDAGELADALTTTVVEAPAPEPKPKPEPEPVKFNVIASSRMSADGPVLEGNKSVRWDIFPVAEDGTVSRKNAAGGYDGVFKASVPAGKYVATARIGKIRKNVPFEASETEALDIEAVFDAGIIRMIPKRTPDDSGGDKSARVQAFFEGGDDGGYGDTTVYAAAGPVTLRARIGKTTVEEEFELKAGETVEKTLIVASGIVVPAAVYAEGGPAVEGNAISFQVVEAKPDLNGKRKRIEHQYGPGKGMNVGAGDYVLVGRLGKAEGEVPITVKGGERTEATVNINAGVLFVSAPGAHHIAILEGKKDIQGKQKRLDQAYGEEYQSTFHPGEYDVVVTYKIDKADVRQKVTVTAGERTEATVE